MSTQAATADDRVGQRSGTVQLLRRPEIGALIGAVVVAIFFLIVAAAFRNVANLGTIRALYERL